MQPPAAAAPAPRATMEDVARLAGVSLKSVSRVVNREPHVSDALRAKVEAAITTLAFVPDAAARSLAGSRTFIVGLLFDNPSPNYTIKIQSGVYRACMEQQYHLRIDSIDSDRPHAQVEAQLDAIVRNSRCDGFILTPPLTDNIQVLAFLERRGIRYARIAPNSELGRSACVAIDDSAAGALVARRLWALGHRQLGVVTGPPLHRAGERRRTGFLNALKELGATLPVAEANGSFAFEGGIAAGTALLAHEPRPSAIFATNDDSAAGVMVACARAGLRVPHDISLCGFDDSWVAKSVWPYLTTIYQPIEEMGYAAASLLLDRGETGDRQLMLDFHLVERDSLAPPPDHPA
ncbi:LacI family DNA-binding transcriptional regulator [Novosphingobium sp. SG720]|uniref:substrate-binding domain-containing protein n=1 Tax=Novosphingobium sp. SG720 TaxID=2586998 RepID=UPI001445DB42